MKRYKSAKAFGDAVVKAVHTEEAYVILGPLIAPKPTSWSRGGCCALALALHELRPAELRMIVRRGKPVHVVYVDGDTYIDAEGPQTLDELEARWSLPRAPARVHKLDKLMLQRAGVKCPPPGALVEYLEQRVGRLQNPSGATPVNRALYEKVKAEAKLKFDVYPSIYANSWVVQEYKRRGGKYRGVGAGLTKWYAEKWVDLARSTDKQGRVKKWVECGRPKAGKRAYPKCVPLAKARSMSPKERRSAIKRKRKVERKTPLRSKSGGSRKPKMVKTYTKPKTKSQAQKRKRVDAAIEKRRKEVERQKVLKEVARKSNPAAKKRRVHKLEKQMEAAGKGAAVGTAVGGIALMPLGPAASLAGAATGSYVGGKVAAKRAAKKHKEEVRRKKAQANPRPFDNRPHNWDEVLIRKGAVCKTRGQILGHYMKHRKDIWPFLRNQFVMVIFAPSKNKFVRRRNGPDGEYIKLTKLKGVDDPSSFEYWIKRRVIEFHPTLMSKRTQLVWFDMDAHESKSDKAMAKALRKMKASVPGVKKVLRKLGAKKLHVYHSGTGRGMHVEGMLDSPRDVDAFRKKLREALHEHFANDPDVLAKGTAKAGQVKLDTSTLHRLGSLRAPYSMTVQGGYKKPA